MAFFNDDQFYKSLLLNLLKFELTIVDVNIIKKQNQKIC